MDNAVFKCLAPPGIPDGTLPSCVLLVCPGQEFDGLDGITHTCDGVGLGVNCGAECAHGVAETYPYVWNDSTSLKIHNPPLTCPPECRLASVPPASRRSRFAGMMHCHLRREQRCQVECNSVDRSDMPLFDGYTQIRVCSSPVSSRRLCRSVLTAPSPRPKSSTRLVARTRLLAGLASWVALLATACFGRQSWSAHVCQRERGRCLSNWVPACLPGDALLDQHKPCANWSERGS